MLVVDRIAAEVVLVEATASSVISQDTWHENALTQMLVVVVQAEELASNAMRKVTWPETAQLEAKEVAADELATSATRKATWQETAQMLVAKETTVDASNAEKKVTWQENAQILALMVVAAVEVVPATNATKKATWLENVLMPEAVVRWTKVPTRDQSRTKVMTTPEVEAVGATQVAVVMLELAVGADLELLLAAGTATLVEFACPRNRSICLLNAAY